VRGYFELRSMPSSRFVLNHDRACGHAADAQLRSLSRAQLIMLGLVAAAVSGVGGAVRPHTHADLDADEHGDAACWGKKWIASRRAAATAAATVLQSPVA
jgi:hypothetical protein